MNNNNTNSASLVKLPGMKGKGKPTGYNHENPTAGPSCLPGGRKLPNLAPKSAIITAESPRLVNRDSLRKRSRVDEDPHSSQLFQPTPHTIDTMPLMNDTGSHIGNTSLEFNGSVTGGSNIQSMANDIHPSDNHILATPINSLPGIQNQSQMETP